MVFTSRGMFLFNEENNRRAALVKVGDLNIDTFRRWREFWWKPAFKRLSVAFQEARNDAENGEYQVGYEPIWTCTKDNYDGKDIIYPPNWNLLHSGGKASFGLRLHEVVKPEANKPDHPVLDLLGVVESECQLDDYWDRDILAGYEYMEMKR
jgi:hypothetical protein